jgi:DNA polymerase I
MYLDFSQFEPGILAQRANDPILLAQYNSRDLYLALSQAIYGDNLHRSLCKVVFLSYCYGMSRERIAGLLVGPGGSESDVMRFDRAIGGFFESYRALEAYRRSLLDDLANKGWISSMMGNRRVRISEGELSPKEQRWAISQAIQGSASLIFKWALLGLANELGPDSILLPMHDAVLMQFDADSVEQSERLATEVLASAFRRWCPDVKPCIVSSDFAAGA